VTSRPWQIVGLATVCFIQAFHLLTAVLGDVLAMSNHQNVEELAKLGLGGQDVDSVYEHLVLSEDIFGIMAVVIFMVGFLLYRGQYLAGVRLFGTIFFAIGFLGYLIAGGSTADGTALSTQGDRVVTLVLTGLLLAGFISLFFGKSAKWVAEHKEG
jgi:hypothetical protein